MKVKGLVLTLLILMISMSVFASSTERYNRKTSDNIPVEKWISQKTLISVPGGITVLDDYIYVTDKGAGTIVVLDKKGNFQRQSSKADHLFLVEPTIIKTDGELLYVIDGEDQQLKIISRHFDLIKSIRLPEESSNIRYWDFEIVNGTVYLMPDVFVQEHSSIYKLDENDEFKKIVGCIGGYLANFNDELMAVNSLEFGYSRPVHDNFVSRGAKSGKNSLFHFTDNRLALKFKFYDGYTPLDFLLLDDFIYVFSGAYVGLDKFTTEGEYVETVLNLNIHDSSLFVQMASYDNTLLLVYPETRSIYKVILGNEEFLDREYEAEVIFFDDSHKAFMLEGGKEVVVIDMLSFKVGSEGCRREINTQKNAIISSLQDLFIQKNPIKLSTPAGLELLNREIRDIVNRVTGFVGENGRYGVLEVYYHITALTSVQ